MPAIQRFTSIVDKFDSPLWGHHCKVPDEVANLFIQGTHRRVICHLNGKVRIQTALMPSPEGWFILLNQEIRDKLGLRAGNKVQVQLEADTSEYGMEMPGELRVMFEQEPEADKLFHALTPGKQRNLIYIVTKVKNTDSRLKKALAIVHHLKETEGQLDFKRLNATIKRYNNM